MKLKLTPKLALVFILFAALLLLGMGILAYNSGRTALEAATLHQLESTAGEKVAALEGWIEHREAGITALSNSPYMIAELTEFLEGGSGAESARARVLQELSLRRGADQPYLNFFLLSPDTGQVILATDPAEEGTYRDEQPYFAEGKTGPFISTVYDSPELKVPAMTAVAPLRGANGQLLGVLAGRLNIEELNTIIQRRSGLRETDDAFLVNSSNLFVTQPRFLPDPAVLTTGIHTGPVQRCLQRNSGTVSAIDYRGVPVIAAYRWLPEREMCLIVKISQAEALAPIATFGRTISWIALAALGSASLIALALSQTIVRPILALQTAAQRYGRGELDMRLPETDRDELGALAREFNQMAGSLAEKELELREHAHTLEQKVQDRTHALQKSYSQLQRAEELGQIGSWEWDIPDNRVIWSDAFYTVFGLTPQDFGATFEAYLQQVHPEDREFVHESTRRALQERTFEYECRIIRRDGQIRSIFTRGEVVLDEHSKPALMTGFAQDITERKQAETAIQLVTEDLRRSNAELEQFAYVASHDLQEPLRMVSSYVQLLGKRYQGKLDGDADEFIGFAVDGAKRMQNLINDLLAYSRVGTRGNPLTPVQGEDLLKTALSNLQFTIEESEAQITHDPLPVVKGDRIQLGMVFQNLLGNAIKFRGSEPPRIHVGAHQEGDDWIFSVRDNGIGIDPKFAERIFVIFQRLNNRAAYPGTGIGLAVCKRIVERHAGRIWLESQGGQGSVFYFSLPV